MSYEKVNWENEGDQNEKDLNAENLGHMDEGIYNLQNVELVAVTDTAPTTCAIGDKYFNTTTNKIYTATAENTWETTGEDATRGILYIVVEEATTYYYNGTTLVSVGGGSGSGSGGSDLIGTVKAYAGETVPENKGYLLCQGQAISRSTYSDLFALIGTTFGVGDGSTTFNLPNLKGRTIVGLDILDTDFNVIGKTGGSKYLQEHQHKKSEPLYKSEYMYGLDGQVYKGEGPLANINVLSGEVANITTGNSGNLQPYMALNYIIKAYETTATQAEVIDSMDGNSTTDAPSVHAVKDYVEASLGSGIAWTDVTFENGWANNSSTYNSCQYKKVGDLLKIRGMVKKSTSNINSTSTIFTLPEGYRPQKTSYIVVCKNDNYYSVIINANGEVTAYNYTANEWVDFGEIIISLD